MREEKKMKTLTKIKLINWHGFYNQTIDLGGPTLIVGENGSGKSTLLDAIMFVLTGGEEKFNTAAGAKSSRTVETYMRGATGDVGSENLRNDANLISHIALEYSDDRSKNKLVIGVVLQIVGGSHSVYRNFYYIPNSNMSDEYFIKDKKYYDFKDMKNYFKERNQDIKELGDRSKVTIRKDIHHIIEMDSTNDRYYELLPRAMASKNIEDINEFVYEFLMPERNANIDEIKKTINSYNEVKKQLDNEKAKKEALKIIVELGDKYRNLEDEKDFLNYYKCKLDDVNLDEKIDKAKKAIKKKEIEKEENENLRSGAEEKKQNALVAKSALENNQEYEQLQKAKAELSRALEYEKEAQDDVDKINALLNSEEVVASYLEPRYNFAKYIRNPNYANFSIDIENYSKLVENKKAELNGNIARVEDNIEKNNKAIAELSEMIRDLNNGIPKYDESLTKLIALIKKDYLETYHKEITITPFCELIEIVNGKQDLRNALEGTLGNKRFDLFVYEKDYDFCVKTYLKYKDSYNINNVGIVNSEKINDKEVLPNSLATALTSEDTRAQKYINYLLGDVIYTGKEIDYDKYESSVSNDVFIYREYVGRQRNKKSYLNPYIGLDSKKIQLENAKNELEKINTNNESLKEQRGQYRRLLSLLMGSKHGTLRETENVWGILEEKIQRREIAQENYDALSTNQSLTKDVQVFDDIIKDCEKRLKELGREYDDIVSIKSRKEDELEKLQLEKEENTKLLEKMSKDVLKLSKAEHYRKSHDFDLDGIYNRISDVERDLEKNKRSLSIKMNDYIEKFSFDATNDIESLSAFYNELNVVVEREFAKYEEKVVNTQKEMELLFKNSYLMELKSNIDSEQENIKRLNAVLKQRPFGSDGEIYQFVYERSKDDKFGPYYDVIMSNQNFETDSPSLWTEGLTDKNNALMQELFSRLTKEGDEDQAKLVREYTDYRRFMSYDIEITKKNGKKSRLSKINRGKSGGETQTPFYVVIAASFDQIVHGGFKNRSAGCLVMLDEAFYNMDESRIESMMQYFNNLSIQPIIAVPTARCRSIVPYVKTVVPLAKSNNRTIVMEWNK